MPRRDDIRSILILGSGPIVIGQACEFDYSGTQACRALRREGYRVILVNSNPATIMTDPEFADATYVEPLVPEVVESILAAERPDAILPTVGGQTGINLTMKLHERGALERYGVELLGADVKALKLGEDHPAHLVDGLLPELRLPDPDRAGVGAGRLRDDHEPPLAVRDGFDPHPVESRDLCRIGRPAQLPHHLGIAFEGFRQREVLIGVWHQLHVTSP